MNEKVVEFKINWFYLIFVALVGTSAILFIGGSVTVQTYNEWSKGLPIASGWSWTSVFILDGFCCLVLFSLFWKLYCDVNTKIGIYGISQPSIFGEKVILWSDITKTEEFNGVGYHLYARDKKIVISPYLYKKPDEVICFIYDHTNI